MKNIGRSLFFTVAVIFASLSIQIGTVLAETKIKLGHPYPAKSAIGQIADFWAQQVSTRSDQSVAVEIYPAGQLGRGREFLELVRIGGADAAISGDFAFINWQAMTLPFTFQNVSEAVEYAGASIDGVEDKSLKVVGYFPVAYAAMASKRAINKPEDLSSRVILNLTGLGGSSIRVMERQGIKTEPWRLDRVTAGIERVNKNDSFVLSACVGLLARNSKDLKATISLTNHQVLGVWLGLSRDTFDKLSSEEQSALESATKETLQFAVANFGNNDKSWIEELKKSGVEVTSPTDLNAIFAAYGPSSTDTNDCTKDEYRAEVKGACKCVAGSKKDEC